MSKNNLLFVFLFVAFFLQNSFCQDLKKEKKEIKDLINLSIGYYKETKYDKALEASKQALISSFAIKNNLYIAQSYNTIGVIFDECSDSKRAILYYEKALRYAYPTKNDTLINWIYGNLGSTYYFNNINVKKGIWYYKKALQISEKTKDSSQIMYTKLNLASALFAIHDYKAGNVYLDAIKEDILSNNDLMAKVSLYTLLAIKSSNSNNIKEAEEYYSKAAQIAELNQYDSYLVNVYENLYNHHKRYNNKEQQEIYRQKKEALSKKIYSEEKLKALDSNAIKIELDEYKIQLEQIDDENQKQQKSLKDSKLVVILFLVILVVLLLLLLTLYKNITLREITNKELQKSNEELKLAKEKAEEASRMKSQFVSTITHELRTPLYGVVGITDILIDEHKELAGSPHLKSLKFSAKYLLSLVNDILQINKIEERRITLESLIFNLTDEIATIKNSIEYIADKNNNKLIIEIDTAIPEFLIGDKLRLSQIIMNLSSNALKFTKNGEVAITAELKRVEGTMQFIEFKVKDTGIGIAPADQEKIFEKFVQIERKEEDYQGTGLGLSIVSSLIGLFNSEIHLESEENVGTTFTFTIGFEYDENKSREIINNIEVDLSLDHMYNILVVEDNKINQMVTKKIIQNSNMTCTIVDDGYAAIVALDREHFDLILMDINMPLINGFDTSRKIREKGNTIPIIALTAFDKQEVTEEAISAGMNDIIVKPFEPAKLFQVISSQIVPKKEN
jgi:signal transduction histidine kinase/CheY-like chemotaxis protein